MRRVTSIIAVMAASTMALAACTSSSTSSTTTSASAGSAASSAAGPKLKVGLAYDIGGRGDKSFNDSAALGLDKAKTDLGIEYKELSATPNETDADKEARLKLLAQGGYDPVIAVGFAYAKALGNVAKSFPKVHFAIVDDASIKDANVTSLTFAEQEGSYLVGVIAAKLSKTGSVGFVGGVDVPLIHKFEAGFFAGAKSVNPSIKTQAKYLTQPPDFSGFNDAQKGEEAANGQFDAGADIVFAAAGGSGTGVFKSAKAKSKLAIGVDSDQYLSASADLKPVIVTSMLKRVDVSVFEMIKSVQAGAPLTGVQVFDLKKDGVGFATSNTSALTNDAKAAADAAKAKIVSGAITVPTN